MSYVLLVLLCKVLHCDKCNVNIKFLVSNYLRECWFFPQYRLRITSFHRINEINSRLVLYNIITNLMPVGYIKKSTNYFKGMIIVLCLIRKCLFKIL
jgi:hypothetical protein